MSAKHTPGPWKIWPEVKGSYPEHLVYISIGAVNGGRVAATSVYGHRRGQANGKRPVISEEECRANARLIVAAPDMRDALKPAELRQVVILLNATGMTDAASALQQIAIQQEAAISKATGEA